MLTQIFHVNSDVFDASYAAGPEFYREDDFLPREFSLVDPKALRGPLNFPRPEQSCTTVGPG